MQAQAIKSKIQLESILSLDDPVTHYARQIVDGEIIAGPHVRASCARHLRDLITGPERGLVWDLEAARFALEFFPAVLRLNGGKFEGIPFEPELWQGFIIGSLFGWKRADTGLRRFQTVYVETGKGSGKSPMAAGVGLFGLIADGEGRAEIYAAATKLDQAKVLFRDAVAMVDYSPDLDARITRSGGKGKEYNLAYHETNSFFKAISADDGQSGPRPHIGLLDEVHEHKDNSVVEMMRAGFKFREQPILFMITNSGQDLRCAGWEYHQYGAEVAAGIREDDSFFSYICGLDKGDDPFKDESCWIKANPSLGVTIQYKYLRDQVVQARGMPGKEALVKRLNFCMWVAGTNPWISYDMWLKCGQDQIDEDELIGRVCYAGLDLGSTQDLTSLVLTFEPTDYDPYWRVLPFFWLPENGLADKADKDKADYLTWVKKGYLETSPGSSVSRLHVLKRVVQLSDKYDIQSMAFDRWRIEDLIQLAKDEGISLPPMIPFGQGFRDMGPAVNISEEFMVGDKLRHNNNPVLTWNAANAVTVSDPTGAKKVAKDKATGRVDGIVAMVMALGKAGAAPEKEKSVSEYLEKHGIRRL